MTTALMTPTTEAHQAALTAEAVYRALRFTVSACETPEAWADLVELAAAWAHAARGWLAAEHDGRAELKVEIILASMGRGTSRSAAEKELEEHPDYRAAVTRMREAERTLALAEARQRHADLRAQVALAQERSHA
jgi:hypothetical protein